MTNNSAFFESELVSVSAGHGKCVPGSNSGHGHGWWHGHGRAHGRGHGTRHHHARLQAVFIAPRHRKRVGALSLPLPPSTTLSLSLSLSATNVVVALTPWTRAAARGSPRCGGAFACAESPAPVPEEAEWIAKPAAPGSWGHGRRTAGPYGGARGIVVGFHEPQQDPEHEHPHQHPESSFHNDVLHHDM